MLFGTFILQMTVISQQELMQYSMSLVTYQIVSGSSSTFVT